MNKKNTAYKKCTIYSFNANLIKFQPIFSFFMRKAIHNDYFQCA